MKEGKQALSSQENDIDALPHDVDTFISFQVSILSQIDNAKRAEVERVRAFNNYKSSVIP